MGVLALLVRVQRDAVVVVELPQGDVSVERPVGEFVVVARVHAQEEGQSAAEEEKRAKILSGQQRNSRNRALKRRRRHGCLHACGGLIRRGGGRNPQFRTVVGREWPGHQRGMMARWRYGRKKGGGRDVIVCRHSLPLRAKEEEGRADAQKLLFLTYWIVNKSNDGQSCVRNMTEKESPAVVVDVVPLFCRLPGQQKTCCCLFLSAPLSPPTDGIGRKEGFPTPSLLSYSCTSLSPPPPFPFR